MVATLQQLLANAKAHKAECEYGRHAHNWGTHSCQRKDNCHDCRWIKACSLMHSLTAWLNCTAVCLIHIPFQISAPLFNSKRLPCLDTRGSGGALTERVGLLPSHCAPLPAAAVEHWWKRSFCTVMQSQTLFYLPAAFQIALTKYGSGFSDGK